MAYFTEFPTIQYDVSGSGVLSTMTNIMRRVNISEKIKENVVAFDFYDVQDGDTPEIVAYYYYQDIGLHWLVLLANNIVDVYSQWPMSIPKFEQYIYEKYDDVNAVHHYEINQTSGDTSILIELPNNVGYPNATPITNYTYESRIQQELSKIRLIRPEYVEQIDREFKNRIKG